MERVLVTGGAGFIGRSLVSMLANDGYRVLALDNYRFANREQAVVHPMVDNIDGDTRNFDQMMELVGKVDHVVHLAAASSFIMHEEDDLEMCSQTMIGFKSLMEAVRKQGHIKHVVWASTSAVYEEHGKKPRAPFHEGLSINPPDSKAGCKWWCEQEAQRYSDRFGITSVAFRPFSVYGVGEHTKLGYANVTSLFTWAMMSGHQPIIWGDGSQTRDFIYVDDVARAFKMAMENHSLPTTALNLGYGKDYTFLESVAMIGEELGINPKPIMVEIPIQIYAEKLLADTTKAEGVLGFTPNISYRDGIRLIIAAVEAMPREVRDQLKLDVQQHYFEKLEKRKLIPTV